MLHILFSNRYEVLEHALIEGLGAGAPLAADEVIVPSAAMRRALALAVARRQGVCANLRFSFLAQWLWRLIGRLVPAVAADSPFAAPVLAWRVWRAFGDPGFVAGHPRLAAYLGQADPVMAFELASRAAGLMEQYLAYRPDWLAAWSAGLPAPSGPATAALAADRDWQAALWRRISAELGTAHEHPAAAFLEAVAARGGHAPAAGLPATAHLFCLPAIPPLYLDLLRELGRWMDLRLYLLNPCREYWFELVDRRRLAHLAARGRLDHHEEGNRLLAAWGKQTQAQLDLLLEAAGPDTLEDGLFVAPGDASLLARLQDAILSLAELAPGGPAPDDHSIQVHVCHSRTRELEVLHDRLLDLFAGPNPPRPSDILVVLPDLEASASLIEAVFGTAPPERHIPYAVTGRARGAFNPAARALLALLELAASRYPASAVFDLMQQPMVARRFGLGAAELTLVHGWLAAAGVRWGIDARHRADLDLPAEPRHSLEDGLDRLFLGYALPDGIDTPFLGRLPAGGAEGGDALVLGALRHCAERLARLPAELAAARPPTAWREAFTALIDGLLEPAAAELDDLFELRDSLAGLEETMLRGGQDGPVPLSVVKAALESLLDDPGRGGVPTGAVTFAAMAGLRALPYRVVCAVGLDDGLFPGTERPGEFDLMAAHPRRGDRQRRQDERNLFLDLILAARERLHLSHTGRSVRDNAPLPPSVLVAELIDYLAPALAANPDDPAALAAARRQLVVEHPLQPFSPRCFQPDEDPRRRSHHREYCDALRQAAAAPAVQTAPAEAAPDAADEAEVAPRQAFFPGPLPAPGAEWRAPTLEALLRFYRNPCRYLLERRLKLDLAAADAELDDAEPFLPDYPGRAALARRLLPHALDGAQPARLAALARAGTEYPAGNLGAGLIDAELATLAGFADAVRAATAAPCLPPHHIELDFQLDGEDWRLTADFADLRPAGLVRHRYDDTRATDYLAAWLAHLCLCAARPPAVAPITTWISRNGQFHLTEPEDARARLAQLLALYRQGLQAPLHFFPKSAWRFMTGKQSLSQARGTWSGAPGHDGESADAAWRLALRGTIEPIDAAFAELARAVYGPLIDHLEDARP